MEEDEESQKDDISLPYEVESGIERWGGIEGLMEMGLDQSLLSRLEKMYTLLSARGRIEILYYLNFSPMTPGLLNILTEMAPNLISFHLRKLENVGVVSHKKEGRHLVYSITDLGESLMGPIQG